MSHKVSKSKKVFATSLTAPDFQGTDDISRWYPGGLCSVLHLHSQVTCTTNVGFTKCHVYLPHSNFYGWDSNHPQMVYGIGFRIRMLISIQSTGRSVLSCRSRMLSYTSTICLHSGNGSGSNFPGQKKGTVSTNKVSVALQRTAPLRQNTCPIGESPMQLASVQRKDSTWKIISTENPWHLPEEAANAWRETGEEWQSCRLQISASLLSPAPAGCPIFLTSFTCS